MPSAVQMVCCPCVLCVQSTRVYCCGCLCLYGEQCSVSCCCGLCAALGFRHKDKKFPAAIKSLGSYQGMSDQQLQEKTIWRSVSSISADKGGIHLFSSENGAKHSINPSDICQGQLGDCWLLSAIACVAAYPGAIFNLFSNSTLNPFGKYKIRLFNPVKKKWERIVIDDMLPCDSKTEQPLFAWSSNECWVALLEKAFAKMCGSYARLDGGNILWAMQALTGDAVFKFRALPTEKKWRRYDLVGQALYNHMPLVFSGFSVTMPNKSFTAVGLRETNEIVSLDGMFKIMEAYIARGSVIGASAAGDDSESTQGIVHGHAYSVMKTVKCGEFHMLKLRNPWGTFEWEGNWSDSSTLWEKHPKVAKACRHEVKNDGAFWICWEDFSNFFSNLDFCARKSGFDDLMLNGNPHMKCCGPTVGCLNGCFRFWCCCKGARTLCASHEPVSTSI